MARTLAVLQSRLSSSRLPGKAMLCVAGMPMVVLAAQRAGNAGAEVVVATSDQPDDIVIAAALERAGIACVRGPLDDPLRRFAIATADLNDNDVVVRLTADNVVPDGELIGWLAEQLGERNYVRIGGDDPALPYGVAAEAFTVRALREADRTATRDSDREHVTPLIREMYGDNTADVPNVACAWAGLRCTVDTFDDYVTISRVFNEVTDPTQISWRALCDSVAQQAPAAGTLSIRSNPLNQSAFVLGTVQLGLLYGAANTDGQPDGATASAIVKAAHASGVTHLDTARAYGESEDRVGDALARGMSEHLKVITKIAPLTDGSGAADVEASFGQSCLALRTRKVDGLLVHRAADWDRPGVRDALVTLRNRGSASVVGASLSTPEELIRLLSDPDFGYAQLPFNLLDRRWLSDEVQAALAQRPDVVIATRSAYLQGLLVSDQARWPVNAGVAPAVVRQGVAQLTAQLRRASAADLCMAYVLGHPWVTSVVAGAETPEQVRDSAQLSRGPVLSKEEIAQVHEVLAPGTAELVDPSKWRQA